MNDLNIPERAAFKPFTRVVSAPPAWPWDQVRAARLEAQHTSPVSGDDVSIVVRRLKSWAWGQPGKFVAIYLRGLDQRQGMKFDLDVQGQRITVDLPSRQQKEAQSLDRAWTLALGAAVLISLAAMSFLMIQRRTIEADRITALETQMQLKAREADGVARAKADAEALAALDLDDRGLEKVLADLNDLSVRRDTSVRLDAFLWNQGYWGVEARGEQPPIKDGIALQRSDKPVRRGVWLWVATDRKSP